MMTPLERFKTVMSFEVPDHVPVMPGITDHYSLWFAAKEKGVPPESLAKDFYQDYKASFNLQMMIAEALPDTKCWPGPFPIMGCYAALPALGCTFSFPDNAPPSVTASPVKKPEDIEKLQVPDLKKDRLVADTLKGLSYFCDNIPPDLKKNLGYVHGTSMSLGPTDVAMQLVGIEQFNIGVYKFPDLILKVMDVATQTVIDLIKAQADISGGYDLVVIFDDTQAFMNAKQFDKFVLPYAQRLYKAFKRKDNVLLLHCDAKCDHLVDKFPSVGFNLWNYGVDMDTAVIKQKLAKKICLLGGVPPMKELKKGTADDIERVCIQAMKAGAQDGGFILSTAAAAAAGTPVQNLKTMIATGPKFGKYPLKL